MIALKILGVLDGRFPILAGQVQTFDKGICEHSETITI